MKKKIFITSHNLRLGGVERALIGLLGSIDYSKYEVDLFLLLHDGVLLNRIPKEVNLLPEIKKYGTPMLPVKKILKYGFPDVLIRKYTARKKADRFVKKNKLSGQNLVYINYLFGEISKTLKPVNHKIYDLAVSFLTPHFVAAQKVKARKKIAWIHTDYTWFEFDKQAEENMWAAYDYIASISKNCTQGFLKEFPQLAGKIVEIENIIPPELIRSQFKEFSAESEMPKNKDEYRFLSIGRFTTAKNFDNVPAIASLLKSKGFNLKWYLIGFGGDEKLIRSKITEFQMEDTVVILGKKENPYPYIKACDIYLQPSRFEGKSVSVREAQILAKPVVITDYPTAASQLKNGFDGIIVPLDNKGCAEEIANLLNNPELLNQLAEDCKNTDYSNQKEIEKIYKLIE